MPGVEDNCQLSTSDPRVLGGVARLRCILLPKEFHAFSVRETESST